MKVQESNKHLDDNKIMEITKNRVKCAGVKFSQSHFAGYVQKINISKLQPIRGKNKDGSRQ